MRPSVKVGVGVVSSAVVALIVWACGTGAQLSPMARCQLDALKVLPPDPGMLTIYDAVDIWERVHACKVQHPDAGAP